jgi:prepilin-type N-terminal cleavage/methylation domain-containing protein
MRYSYSRRRECTGFSLSEVIVVLTIIVLLGAILLPVIGAAKERAHETSCSENLHNLYLSIAMYREDWGGSSVGTASEMGFPSPHAYMGLHSPQFRCADAHFPFSERFPYFYIAIDSVHVSQHTMAWKDYVAIQGDQAFLLADLNHNRRDRPYSSPYFTTRALAMNIGGSAKIIAKRADWEDLGSSFWR